jgi:hypothetical protein
MLLPLPGLIIFGTDDLGKGYVSDTNIHDIDRVAWNSQWVVVASASKCCAVSTTSDQVIRSSDLVALRTTLGDRAGTDFPTTLLPLGEALARRESELGWALSDRKELSPYIGTVNALWLIASELHDYREQYREFPDTLEALAERNRRESEFIRMRCIDDWGHPLLYRRSDNGGGPILLSVGSRKTGPIQAPDWWLESGPGYADY